MNYEQLKNSILQEAIEGRLVPQDHNDEPASVLLDRIRDEKAKLVKEKKIKKDKNESRIYRSADGHWMEHFTDKKRPDVCIDDEIPFDIPETWEWCRLSLICQHNPQVEAKDDDDAAFMPMAYISNGLSNFYKYDIRKWKEIKNGFRRFKDGDMAFAKITPCFQNGKSFIAHDLPNHIGAGTTELHVMRVYGQTIKIEYLYFFIKSPYFMLQAKYKGTAGQQRVLKEYIDNKLFPLPPLSEQHRIVDKLEQILPKVEEYGKAQERLDTLNAELPEKLRTSILQEAIEGRLVPQDPNDEPASVLLDRIRDEKAKLVKEKKIKKDKNESRIYRSADGHWMEHFTDKKRPDVCIDDEIPFDIPETWEWTRMQNVIEFINGRAYKREELLEKGKYRVLRVGNFFTNQCWYYSDLELPDKNYCYKGDLLYAWSASFGPRIWEGNKTIFHYHIWKVKFNESLLYKKYLYYFFLIDKNYLASSTTGSTMIHVSMENMKPRFIPIPPFSEQHRIVEKLDSILPMLDTFKKR